ncbi:hypothetical protein DH2020_006479 [Rehmannia glutinosa]|uniref:Uncharacterized protein n=1 Tax=Rehmannia glutinosa TaxID=99300 RepID=A0ABR0XIY9_REHGL
MSDKSLSIDELCGRMQLEEEESGGLCLEESEEDGLTQEFRWCLVGRFLSERQVNFLAMKNTLASLWRPIKCLFNANNVSEERAYGSWLRAPSRKYQNQVGSQWLRTSAISKFSDQSHEEDDGYFGDKVGANYVPNFSDSGQNVEGKCMHYGTVIGENSGYSGDAVTKEKNLNDDGNVVGALTIYEARHATNHLKGDNKRKRVEYINLSNSGDIGLNLGGPALLKSGVSQNQKNVNAVGSGSQAHRAL